MKIALTVIIATIVPGGFVVVALAFLGHMLARRSNEMAAGVAPG